MERKHHSHRDTLIQENKFTLSCGIEVVKGKFDFTIAPIRLASSSSSRPSPSPRPAKPSRTPNDVSRAFRFVRVELHIRRAARNAFTRSDSCSGDVARCRNLAVIYYCISSDRSRGKFHSGIRRCKHDPSSET